MALRVEYVAGCDLPFCCKCIGKLPWCLLSFDCSILIQRATGAAVAGVMSRMS